MAPTPVDTPPEAQPKPTAQPQKEDSGLSTASIVGICIFAFFGLAFIVTGVAFYMHRRAERNKLPPEARPMSYRPYRRASSVKDSLIQNAAPSPEDDKSSMFSRDRNSSLSLYVDTDAHDQRGSMDAVSLIPLHVTPAEEVHDPIGRTLSDGSGVSSISRYSTTTSGGSLGVRNIPIPEEEDDLGVRRNRNRSSSAASARYYETTDTVAVPQVPRIVHTHSP